MFFEMITLAFNIPIWLWCNWKCLWRIVHYAFHFLTPSKIIMDKKLNSLKNGKSTIHMSSLCNMTHITLVKVVINMLHRFGYFKLLQVLNEWSSMSASPRNVKLSLMSIIWAYTGANNSKCHPENCALLQAANTDWLSHAIMTTKTSGLKLKYLLWNRMKIGNVL